MNTGQVMLVIASFSLLSVLTLSINTTIINNTSLGLEQEADLDAVSIAQSMMDEIMDKAFDQAVVGGTRAWTPTIFSATNNFGPESGEPSVYTSTTNVVYDTNNAGNFASKRNFNDVDDYNNYHRKAWDARMGWFTLVDSVQYVDDKTLGPTSSRTYAKLITVTVTQQNMTKDLRYTYDVVLPVRLKNIAIYRRYF